MCKVLCRLSTFLVGLYNFSPFFCPLNYLSTLLGYMILQLMEIPAFYGDKLLDKLRYLQLELKQRCSIIHWSYDFLPEALVA